MMDNTSVSAFSPGHITGFFEICDTLTPATLCGSRGAGICTSLGAVSTVTVQHKGQPGVHIILNNRVSSALVTRHAIDLLLPRNQLSVSVDIKTHLPCSQGFGMSAAGTLATTLALSHLVGVSREKAVEAAHLAEIEMKTGLGDVVSCNTGGIVIRLEPGITGDLRKIPGVHPIALGVMGHGINTRDIIDDPELRERISHYGSECMAELIQDPTLETFFHLSLNFANKTGLASSKIRGVLKKVNAVGLASMCMLGTSLFAIGDMDKITQTLLSHGEIYQCHVDLQGARLLSL